MRVERARLDRFPFGGVAVARVVRGFATSGSAMGWRSRQAPMSCSMREIAMPCLRSSSG
jgi:hypothetical protein